MSETYFPELVELYEYKVADALAGHPSRGGKYALMDLRQALLAAHLEGPLHKRFMQVDKRYREWCSGQTSSTSSTTSQAPPSFNIDPHKQELPINPDTPEIKAWRELRILAWHAELKQKIQIHCRELRYETDHPSLRVLYAVTENAERRMQNIPDIFPVPMARDPLVSLGNAEVVTTLAESFANILVTTEGRTLIQEALQYVIDKPFSRHPDEEALQKQLDIVKREHLNVIDREDLIQALRKKYSQANDPKEAPPIRNAAKSWQKTLSNWFTEIKNQDTAAFPEHSILFAQNEEACQYQIDHGAEELLIYLNGEIQEIEWRGREICWQSSGINWHMQFKAPDASDGRDHLLTLRPDVPAAERSASIKESDAPLEIFLSGDYLLLRIKTPPEDVMSSLATHARAVAAMVDPAEDYAGLRLARAVAQQFRDGRVNLEAVKPESGHHYTLVPYRNLLAFARKGIKTLSLQLQQVKPAGAAENFKLSANALGLSEEIGLNLHQLLHAATFKTERLSPPNPDSMAYMPHLGATNKFYSLSLAQQPINIPLPNNRAMTIRTNFMGDWVALIPGRPPYLLQDLLVITLGNANLIMVRHGDWMAIAAQKGSALGDLTQQPGALLP